MQKCDTKGWNPVYKDHDTLLLKYCQKHGGMTFTNVKVDDDPYQPPREIDAVRFPSRRCKLARWAKHREEFDGQLFHAQQDRLPVEIIEVSTGKMNDRATAGQVIVGSWLLEQYKVKVTKVLVYDSATPRLREFFKKNHVTVWTPKEND